MRTAVAGLVVAVGLVFGWPSVANAASVSGDFNGDGYADLAIGVPNEDVGVSSPQVDAGAVNVIYGGPGGLTAAGNQLWTQDSPGIRDTAEAGDHFGASLAVGDFNGDGYADLAVGVPGEDVSGVSDAGAVNVIYGGPSGLTSTGNQFLAGALYGPQSGDHFGAALAAGEFGETTFGHFEDLAIGIPYHDGSHTAPVSDAGAVDVVYGRSSGLYTPSMREYTQDTAGAGDAAEQGDHFGAALAAGPLYSGVTMDDLVVGVPDEDIGGAVDAGAVNIFTPNASTGLAGGPSFNLDSPNVAGTATAGDHFGAALAIGRFVANNSQDELAVGVPDATVGSVADAGSVEEFTSGSNGPDRGVIWSQDSPYVRDTAEEGDHFGAALAAGDVGGPTPSAAALIIGVPDKDVGSSAPVTDAGAVALLNGRASIGLTTSGNQLWSQNSSGILDRAEAGDYFGAALAVGDFNGDGYDDIAIGVPGEDIGTAAPVADAGAVNVIYGTPSGLTSSMNQFWSQNSPGILDAAETGDGFGLALGAFAAPSN